jgi:hypothetical protein
VILKAEPLDPSFQWRSHKPERRPWRIVALLLAIAVGAGFLVGRLSTAGPTSLQQQVAAEQQATSAGRVMQSQGPTQSDLAGAAVRSTTTDSVDMKPATKDEPKKNTTASATATETPKAQSTTSTEKASTSPPVVLINPSTADKSDKDVAGEATKKAASKVETETPAKATSKAETHKATDDAAPAASKRQAKSPASGHSSASAAPARQESAAARRDDAYGAPRRDDSFVASRRDDAYVPPRVPESTLSDQRERYEGVERREDRARFEPPYRDRRYPEPDPRYAEDMPPRRDAYEDSRGYLRPFRGARDFRDYRRFDGYEDDAFTDRRPVLRPMTGGPND